MMKFEIEKGLIRSNGVAYSVGSIIKVTSTIPKSKNNPAKLIIIIFGILAIGASFGNTEANIIARIVLFSAGSFMIYFSSRLESRIIIGFGLINIDTASGEYKIYESESESELAMVRTKIEEAIKNSK